VAVLATGKLMQPRAIADAIPEDFRQVFHQPSGLDGSGTLGAVRYRVNLRRCRKRGRRPRLWPFGATSYAQGRWTQC
jgi:hypothetical protein